MKEKCEICHKTIAVPEMAGILYSKHHEDPEDGRLGHHRCLQEILDIMTEREDIEHNDWLILPFTEVLKNPTLTMRLRFNIDISTSTEAKTICKEALQNSSVKLPPLSYVYVVSGESEGFQLYKIGKSNTPKIRLGQLRHQYNVKNLHLEHKIAIRVGLAGTLELLLHNLFADRRADRYSLILDGLGREWFLLYPDDLEWLKSLSYIRDLPRVLRVWKAE